MEKKSIKDVFLFGSVVVTTGLLLENQYPEPDGYGELSQVDLFLGGECGVAAAMLHHFGCSCKLMGFQLGYETDSVVKNYFKNTNVDVSAQSTAQPFQVQVKSTLSAGDSFRTGCIYGLLKGLSDSETVDFASALAGCALTKYPITNNLPDLDEVLSLIKSR